MRQNWQMWQSAVSRDDCDTIIEQFRNQPPCDGQTFNSCGKLEENPFRSSKVRWVEDPALRDMLWWFAKEANRFAFGFDVSDSGSIQFTEYSAEYSGKYDWHHDIDWNGNAAFDRKISVVLQLSDPEYYGGCDFLFDEVESPDASKLRSKGTVICFPSYLRHQVTPITKGTRYSLVAWFEGPRWR